MASKTAQQQALAAFHPTNFGLVQRMDVPNPEEERAWYSDVAGIGKVGFMTLTWAHANGTTNWTDAAGNDHPVSFLELVSRLQGQVWGMGDFDVLPPIGLAKVEESGGCLGVAYRAEVGFNSAGWLGFVMGFGSPTGTLYSHMLATNPTARNNNIGWLLKVMQAYHAVRLGHTIMRWTFDPMRGINGMLNVVKLGGALDLYIVDYYGGWSNALYGRVPTDRFKVRWSLNDPAVHERLKHIYAGTYRATPIEEVQALPMANGATIDGLIETKPPRIAFEIPGDIDTVAAENPARMLEKRAEMRAVLARLLDLRRPVYTDTHTFDPARLGVELAWGKYQVTDFVSAMVDGHHGENAEHHEGRERRNYYVLTLK